MACVVLCSICSLAWRWHFDWSACLLSLQQAGIDFAREIPYRRFGYEDMYDPDVEAHKRWKCCAKHGVFIEGEDLFDPKIFTISMVEVRHVAQKLSLSLEQTAQVQRQLVQVQRELFWKLGTVLALVCCSAVAAPLMCPRDGGLPFLCHFLL